MTPAQLARVLRAGPEALSGLTVESMNKMTPAQALGVALAGMAAKAEEIDRETR